MPHKGNLFGAEGRSIREANSSVERSGYRALKCTGPQCSRTVLRSGIFVGGVEELIRRLGSHVSAYSARMIHPSARQFNQYVSDEQPYPLQKSGSSTHFGAEACVRWTPCDNLTEQAPT